MSKRSGQFWDAIEGRVPLPRAAATLGLEFINVDIQKGTIELALAARPGKIVGNDRVVHREGDLAFLEASLLDSDGTLIGTATAAARVIALDGARTAA
jgi:hypothetical protein